MPYIITTKQPSEPDAYSRFKDAQADGRIGPLYRRAVATLDEAREIAAETVDRDGDDIRLDGFHYTINRLPEQGGSIGPLPDGTVIEVTAVCWNWIIGCAEDLGIDTERIHADAATGSGDRAIMDAYNAAQ